MKNPLAILAILALPFAVTAQQQNFLLPAYFATNVFLADNTNTPLHVRMTSLEQSNITAWAESPAITNVDMNGFGLSDVALIEMEANGNSGTNPGALFWNSDFGTLNLIMDKLNPDGTPVTQELGYNSLVRVKNASGSTISNTWAVSIVPGTGGILTVERARQPDKTRVIGVASHNIPDGEEGIVNWFGEISQAQTFGLTEGAEIYLSTNTAGINWTTNLAEAGASPMRLGYVDTTASNPNSGNGKIIVDIFDIEADPVAMAALTNYVAITNLSTIAGSGLGVVSNQLTVTNVANQSSLTGVVQISGIDVGVGSNLIIRAGNRQSVGGSGGSIYINAGTDGASGFGSIYITNTLISTSIEGQFGGSIGGNLTIKGGSSNPSQLGGNLLIGGGTYSGPGTNGQVVLLTTFNAGGNSITNIGNLQGNAANLTNFPSSLLTVSAGNANYWRVTTAPTGATASGQSGQMAVDGTNLFIYSPNALGAGTARWIRVSGSATW